MMFTVLECITSQNSIPCSHGLSMAVAVAVCLFFSVSGPQDVGVWHTRLESARIF